jgi:metallopeptidase MepB
MFAAMFDDGVLDNNVGRKYRHQVLEKGGSRDEVDILTEFLGRAPNAEAFERELGVFRSSETTP